MKFQLSATVLLVAASQFSLAEMPNSIEAASSNKQSYSAALEEPKSETSQGSPDAGTLPEAVIKVANSLELKLEQRLQASFDLGFIGGKKVASAY
ncbi:MAG: hypothetical protein ACJAUG_000700 [Halioglobus sp.]|jgi:hypothetical protein